MIPLIRHLALFLLSSVCLAAAAFAAGGTVPALAVWSGLLLLWLVWNGFNTARLLSWLRNPSRPLPEGAGLWQDVFSQMRGHEKKRMQQQRQFRRTMRRFIRTAEAAPGGVLVLDGEGRIEWLNRLGAAHLGLNPQKDRGGILKNLVRDPEFYDLLRKKSSVQETVLRFRESGTAPRSIAVTRTDLGGSFLLTTQDVTAAEHADTTRTAFVANVSHELRTPLTVINGFLETLADMPGLPQAQQQQFVALMRQEGQRMLDLLSDLLTLTRLEDRHAHLSVERVNLSRLCAQIAEEGRVLSDGRHRIHTDITPDAWIEGMPKDLYSALSNLVFNAVRYTPEGGVIGISLVPEGSGLRLSVRDNGPGIAPEHIPHLTERFYRVDSGRSRQSGGTGLGLAITKHALIKHGTDLDIRSEVGRGSEFSARFAAAGKGDSR